jgi:hypothetical protein
MFYQRKNKIDKKETRRQRREGETEKLSRETENK